MFGAAALVFQSQYRGHIGRIRGSACNQHVCGKRGLYAVIMHAQVVYAESALKVSQFPASPLSIHRWERIQAQLVMIIRIPNLITDLMMINGMMMNKVRKTRSLLMCYFPGQSYLHSENHASK